MAYFQMNKINKTRRLYPDYKGNRLVVVKDEETVTDDEGDGAFLYNCDACGEPVYENDPINEGYHPVGLCYSCACADE